MYGKCVLNTPLPRRLLNVSVYGNDGNTQGGDVTGSMVTIRSPFCGYEMP